MGLDMFVYAKKGEEENEVLYWRKQNAIHKWFVDNVQNGVDDCGVYKVTRDKLLELMNVIKEAITKKDHKILPTQSGFFFGSTEIDEYYWDSLSRSIKSINNMLVEYDESYDFYYVSSW